jgi:subfamily B ATP-binding cassette protein MsbA
MRHRPTFPAEMAVQVQFASDMSREPTHPNRPEGRAAGRHVTAGQWRRHIGILLMLARVGGVRPWHYALPVTLLLVAATLEGLTMALLVPLARGLASDSFSIVWELAGFSTFRRWFPDAAAVFSGSNRRTFLLLVGLLFASSMLGSALALAAARICAWRNGIYAARVKAHTLARCLSFGKLYFDRSSLTTAYEAIGFSEVLLSVLAGLETAVESALRLAAHVVVMVAISWPMTLFMAIAFPALRAIDRSIVRRSARASESALETGHEFAVQVFNIISSIPLMKTLALESRARRRFEELVERMRVFSLERDQAALVAGPLQQMVALTALLIIVVIAVALARTDRTVELSVMCAFLLVVRRAVPTLGFVTNLRLRLSQAQPSLRRLAEVFDDDGKCFVSSGPREFQGLRQGIEFRNLSFAYTDDLPVLRGLSCTLPAGTTTALVGETGCGKTTVASVLARLYECPPATVFFDGIDIREFSHDSLARRISYVGQEAWLFNDTLRANLVVGLDRPAPDEELLDLLNRVRLGPMMAALPAGLDTEIGDAGVRFSGGERQRLCIVRALLRRADLVLLDEATSALDSQTERDVLQAIGQATRGATVVTIAHRLSTVQSADKVLVLAHGELIEEGTWNQLVSAQGTLALLWKLQSQSATKPTGAVHGAG